MIAQRISAIGEEEFAQMKQLASEFLGFHLEQQTHPIPPLNPRWLE